MEGGVPFWVKDAHITSWPIRISDDTLPYADAYRKPYLDLLALGTWPSSNLKPPDSCRRGLGNA